MIRSTTGLIHTVAAVAALVTGALVLLRPKGGAWHRGVGYAYAGSMIVVIATSFAIFRLTGRLNILHAAAILSTVTLAAGLRHAIWRQRPDWLEGHYAWMSWSYVGLVAALLAELATRVGMPWVVTTYGLRAMGVFWTIVGLATFVVTLTGAILIRRNRALARRP